MVRSVNGVVKFEESDSSLTKIMGAVRHSKRIETGTA